MKQLLLALASVMIVSITEARPIHILPLGDSITQGGRADRPEYTYRYPLYGMLTVAGYEFDFIGSLTKGLQPGAHWPVPFDLHHEGHYGWKTGAVRDKLPEWIPQWQAAPDIVLIHLGTNDQGAKDHTMAVVQPLTEIITRLRREDPHVVVLVAHLNFNDGAALKIRPLVERLAKTMSTAQSPVVTVPMYAGWVEDPSKPGTDTFDWAHPNLQGQQKMAKQWFAVLQPFLTKLTDGPRTNWRSR